jgi:hypothetical protein
MNEFLIPPGKLKENTVCGQTAAVKIRDNSPPSLQPDIKEIER